MTLGPGRQLTVAVRHGVDARPWAAGCDSVDGFDESSWAGSVSGEFVVVIYDAAGGQRQAAATDAFGEFVFEVFDLAASSLELNVPATRDAVPVGLARHAVVGPVGEDGGHLGQGDAEPAGGLDDADATQYVAGIAALIPECAHRTDEALIFVKSHGARGDSGTSGHLADGEHVGWFVRQRLLSLDFNWT